MIKMFANSVMKETNNITDVGLSFLAFVANNLEFLAEVYLNAVLLFARALFELSFLKRDSFVRGPHSEIWEIVNEKEAKEDLQNLTLLAVKMRRLFFKIELCFKFYLARH